MRRIPRQKPAIVPPEFEKDEHGIYVKKAPEVPSQPPAPDLGPMPDADANSLLRKSMEILRREVISLSTQASIGKLNEKSARDLSSYVRLLHDLAKDEKDVLGDMTDEEIEKELEKRRGDKA